MARKGFGPTLIKSSEFHLADRRPDNTRHSQQTLMIPVAFEPTISLSGTKSPLPDNTQHSQQTDIHDPGGI